MTSTNNLEKSFKKSLLHLCGQQISNKLSSELENGDTDGDSALLFVFKMP